jgi:hypothetical protein
MYKQSRPGVFSSFRIATLACNHVILGETACVATNMAPRHHSHFPTVPLLETSLGPANMPIVDYLQLRLSPQTKITLPGSDEFGNATKRWSIQSTPGFDLIVALDPNSQSL